MNWSLDLGMMTNHSLPESTGQSPESLFSKLIGNQGNSIPGNNIDENKVLMCYPNLDQIMLG
jgi:hypothetical protein